MNQQSLIKLFDEFFQKLIDQISEIQLKKNSYSEEDTKKIIFNFEQTILNYSSFYSFEYSEQDEYNRFLSNLKDAQYAMTSIADEIFLNTEWSGKKCWEFNLLEEKIFKSHVSGVEIFTKIKKIIDSINPSKEIASIYLSLLGLGFKGKFRSDNKIEESKNEEEIGIFKKKLFEIIYQGQTINNNNKIFPKAYHYTIVSSENDIIRKSKFSYIILSVFCIFITVGYFVWKIKTHDINKNVNRMIKIITK